MRRTRAYRLVAVLALAWAATCRADDAAGGSATAPATQALSPRQQMLNDVLDGTEFTRSGSDLCKLLIEELDRFPTSQGDVPLVTVDDLYDADRRESLRGRPVRMRLTFVESAPIAMAFRDRTRNSVQIVATGPSSGTRPKPEPVVLACFPPVVPPAMQRGQSFEVSGYFFKIGRFASKDGHAEAPILIVYHITPAEVTPPAPRPARSRTFLVFGALMLLVGGWAVVRRMSRRPAKLTGPQYRPMRFEMTPEENERTKITLDDERSKSPPDPTA